MAHGKEHTQSDHSDMTISSPADGEALVYENSTSKWKNKKSLSRPSCRGYGANVQSINNNSWTTIVIDAGNFDTHTMLGANKVTIPTGQAGKYLIMCGVSFDPHATGARSIKIRVNGSTYAYVKHEAVEAADHTVMIVSTIEDLSAADEITVQAIQNSGGNLNLPGNRQSRWLAVMRMD